MVSGADEQQTAETTRDIHSLLKKAFEQADCEAQMLDPVPAPILKIKNKYRYRILIKCPSYEALEAPLRMINARHEKMKGKTFLSIDVNPNSMY